MPTTRNMRAAYLDQMFENGRRDCREEQAAITSAEAERRSLAREERGDAEMAAYWLGYAEEAAWIETDGEPQ